MKIFSYLVCSSFACFFLNACSFSSRASKKLFEESKSQVYDVIVVPGVPFENEQWSRVMKARVYWSKYLYDIGIAKNVMYSGSSVYTPYYEAEIMAMYGEAIGIPKERILIETKAEHSTENIYYSYKKAKKLGYLSVALASDPFQTKMLRRFTRKSVSRDVRLIPMVFDTLRALEPRMIDPVIDFRQTINKEFIPIGKRHGFWKRFKGTLGYNLDTSAYE